MSAVENILHDALHLVHDPHGHTQTAQGFPLLSLMYLLVDYLHAVFHDEILMSRRTSVRFLFLWLKSHHSLRLKISSVSVKPATFLATDDIMADVIFKCSVSMAWRL